jgi:hypothetical protein
MKAYLITTGTLFGVLAVAHVLQAVQEWPRLASDLWFDLEAGIGILAAALSVWAWGLLRRVASQS